jgi:alpha-galactosidase
MSGTGSRAVRHALAVLACAVAALAVAAPAWALPDGLAQTPPMGFNNWNDTQCDEGFNEDYVKSMADLFVATGLKDAGYEYINLDDCWARPQNSPQGSRDADGHLVPDPVRFPNGIDAVADYVHGQDLKFGIYTDRGTRTCNTQGFDGTLGADWTPGAPTYEYIDAQDFADWGVDYLKYDNCNNEGLDARERYTIMRDALEATGRDIVYSICEWGQNDPWLWGADVGHLWRTTGDIAPNYASMSNIARHNLTLAEHAGPGHWNDPDMLQVGNGSWSVTEQRAHFSLWSIMAAPLLIGTDLRQATPATMQILLNKEAIAVDQDRLGIQGDLVRPADDGRYVIAKPLENGDVAVTLWNDTSSSARIATTAAELGLPEADAYTIRDLWAHETRETAGAVTATVPSHGTAMYRIAVDRQWYRYPPAVDALVELEPAYPGATPVVAPGSTVTATTTVTNAGQQPAQSVRVDLSAPQGWDVEATSSTTIPALETDQSLETTWDVTAPAGVSPGMYTLEATATYRWPNGKTETVRSQVEVAVPVPPPGGTSYLSDITWLSATNGWGPVERDTSNGEQGAGDGNPMTIEGVVYAKGLGAHAPSEIQYYLGGACSHVGADVGLDDEEGSLGTVTFEIWADGRKVADSGLMTNTMAAQHLEADLTGATFLRLIVRDGGDNVNNDHADWADARLECELRPPPAGTSYLSDLPWQSAINGWGPVERDQSVNGQAAGDGNPITIGGVVYEKGLGAHAPSEIEYYLGGNCSTVRSDVGVDDEVTSSAASVTFEIWADDAKVAETGAMTATMPAATLTADVTGAGTLRLVVTDAGDGKNSDHADWADARVQCA